MTAKKTEQKEFIDHIEQLGKQALVASFNVHERLGSLGEELVAKNQFGDTALRVDIEAEKAVIDVLTQSEIPLVTYSEEHGVVTLGETPRILVVLDGMDGSDEYKNFRGKGRYGTMLGIYTNPNPKYADYLFGGIMEHAQRRLVWAAQGKGTFVEQHGHVQQIHTSGVTHFGNQTRVYYSEKYLEQFKAPKPAFIRSFTPHQHHHLGSTASHYADLARGLVDMFIESTRKGNLEFAAGYPLVVEAGGDMVNEQGESIRDEYFLTFGQNQGVALIATATRDLANDLLGL